MLQIVKVTMDDVDMDNFVFCLAHKRVVSKLQKDMLDLVSGRHTKFGMINQLSHLIRTNVVFIYIKTPNHISMF